MCNRKKRGGGSADDDCEGGDEFKSPVVRDGMQNRGILARSDKYFGKENGQGQAP